jgi:hypothetical protein
MPLTQVTLLFQLNVDGNFFLLLASFYILTSAIRSDRRFWRWKMLDLIFLFANKHKTKQVRGYLIRSAWHITTIQHVDINKYVNYYMCHLPTVGTVERTSPMCSRYNIVVFPAASRPSITTYEKANTVSLTDSDKHRVVRPWKLKIWNWTNGSRLQVTVNCRICVRARFQLHNIFKN